MASDISALVAVGVLLGLSSMCAAEERPTLTEPAVVEKLVSPDGKLKTVVSVRSATEWTHSNYWYVSILPVDAPSPSDKGNIFSSDSEYVPRYRTVTTTWLSSDHVEVSYHPRVVPVFSLDRFREVSVTVVIRGTNHDYVEDLEAIIVGFLRGDIDYWRFLWEYQGYYLGPSDRIEYQHDIETSRDPYVLAPLDQTFFDDVWEHRLDFERLGGWLQPAYNTYKSIQRSGGRAN